MKNNSLTAKLQTLRQEVVKTEQEFFNYFFLLRLLTSEGTQNLTNFDWFVMLIQNQINQFHRSFGGQAPDPSNSKYTITSNVLMEYYFYTWAYRRLQTDWASYQDIVNWAEKNTPYYNLANVQARLMDLSGHVNAL